MKFARVLWFVILCGVAPVFGQNATPAAQPSVAQNASARTSDDTANATPPSDTKAAASEQRAKNDSAAAAVAAGQGRFESPDILEEFVDSILARFNVTTSGNTTTHYIISAVFLLGALVLRRVVTTVIFGILRKLAARTKTTFDDKLFPALEAPTATLILVVGIVAALKVLKLPASVDRLLNPGATMAFSLCVFWLLLRAFTTLLDHSEQVARSKQMGIAALMPWIKKTLVTIFIVFGVLMVAQSVGFKVQPFLAGLGIGGLAFALAAQDTIANLFGSVVVAIDQPFKIGEFVQIGGNGGTVEDIGLRSTKLRKADKSLVIIPNKTVAAEAIVNLSRFTQRRVEQTLGLTYDATPDQLEGLVNELRDMILAEPEVDRSSVIVQFTNFGASSLDIWVVYNTLGADFGKHLLLKQRLNLKFMRAVAARGLSFAFPTQTVFLDGPIARRMVEKPDERV